MNSDTRIFVSIVIFIVLFEVMALFEQNMRYSAQESSRRVLASEYVITVLNKEGTSSTLDPNLVDRVILEKR